jgi:hypothetical protein
MNEQDLRDCFAMFALIGVKTSSNFEEQAKWCYEMADAMLEARKPKEVGIKTVKRMRKSDNET